MHPTHPLTLPRSHRLGIAALAVCIGTALLQLVTGLGAPERSHAIAQAQLQRSAAPAAAVATQLPVAVLAAASAPVAQ